MVGQDGRDEWGGEEAMFSSVWSGLDQRDGELEPPFQANSRAAEGLWAAVA
jgi:hypothetical protein